MSRIHEALKKAAEERSSKLATDSAMDLDVASELTASSIAEKVLDRPAPRTDVRKPADPARSSFEELVKKCAHPRWVADPRTSVFHGADRHQVGAERFRTLRSRL